MKYIQRKLEGSLRKYLKAFPVVAVTGPRQSGKSTLLKETLGKNYKYVSFDDPILVDYFGQDPKGFMNEYNNKVIFDEVQKAPEIFNYLKMEVDAARDQYGKYVITGSSQFSFIKSITESLAGRIGMLSLLPFGMTELSTKSRKQQLLKGSYPELVMRNYADHTDWYAAYINTYIERDVRSLTNIGNLRDFQRLVSLLAAQTSSELNFSRLSKDLGVTVKTVQHWVSVLEASYIIFLLKPYTNNLGKRIVKRPKIYFYDTGLVCYLTGLRDLKVLQKGPLSGPIFENFIVAEILKGISHNKMDTELYYYRTNLGLEVDLIIENIEKSKKYFIEIKNSSTAKPMMTNNIKKLLDLSKDLKIPKTYKNKGVLLYQGKDKAIKDTLTEIRHYSDFISEMF